MKGGERGGGVQTRERAGGQTDRQAGRPPPRSSGWKIGRVGPGRQASVSSRPKHGRGKRDEISKPSENRRRRSEGLIGTSERVRSVRSARARGGPAIATQPHFVAMLLWGDGTTKLRRLLATTANGCHVRGQLSWRVLI